ncbi:MarR family winged helix-turn-helix transcriptional regulator [Roseomonas sp. BN140053]|uniref:MarR family winged helix-turn-helix transcriptional regulator n=1 Tax=Roseomonas sp. BN140053 TaxID=3391898 RepID=UPI0039EA7EB9
MSQDASPRPLPFEESLGFLVRDLNRLIQREIGAQISVHGVSPGAWYFLRMLWEEDGLTQRELSQRIGMMEPTAVVALRGIEAEGWIRRERNAQDRRKVHMYLTPAGWALREKLLPIAHAVNAQVVQGLTPDEANFLRALLRRARANFGPGMAEEG